MPQIYINGDRIGGYEALCKVLKPRFDFDKLHKVVKVVTKNLNKVIDVNYYPVPETRNSNMRHRPIGLGVQGLADVFAMLKLPFGGEESKEINRRIFETMYFSACETSMELAKKREQNIVKYKALLEELKTLDDSKDTDSKAEEDKLKLKAKLEKELGEVDLDRTEFMGTYSTYKGSPMSQGLFQFDLWGVKPSKEMESKWNKLRKDVKKYGIRNSLLMALMPTASTSQILGNNECFEPFTSNIYIR